MNQEDVIKSVLSDYRKIQITLRPKSTHQQRTMVSKAFRLAFNAHQNMWRLNGDPYIIHPLQVALIVLEELNLGATSVICALLHDVVEDTTYTLEDIENLFGKEVSRIIDGLTKIEDFSLIDVDTQYENYRKTLLYMCDDPRVILIKLADRLHNMRTLAFMPDHKQQKIASETSYFYAPLAHRLGLYNIKSELEDLSMKYREPGSYQFIENKIKETEKEREEFTHEFIMPIQNELEKKGFRFEIFQRIKSIHSIWQKMTKKQIPFEEIHDLFAVRIVIDVEEEFQNSACWSVYSIVTDIYTPRYDRLRDWVAKPKPNGYQALHITVMSKTGRWVEVQIRSGTMDRIAENGFAAHWAYKNDSKSDEQAMATLLSNIRERLQKNENDVGSLMSSIQMTLGVKEISVFTQQGEEYSLPKDATVIDFAYNLSPEQGAHCIGAKVNNKLVPPTKILQSGDQVEIITSTKQKVNADWIHAVVTAKAKDHIMEAIELEKRNKITAGKELLKSFLVQNHIEPNQANREKLMLFLGFNHKDDLYLALDHGEVTERDVKQCFATYNIASATVRRLKACLERLRQRVAVFFMLDRVILLRKATNNPDNSLLEENVQEIKRTTIAQCCNPVAGDPIIAFNISDTEMLIHHSNCSKAIQFAARYGNKIVKAKWRKTSLSAEFLAGVSLNGFDERGIVHAITSVIAQDFQINCRSIFFETSEGIFEGKIMLYIQNVERLNKLMAQLRLLPGIEKVERI
jgi:GTP pyrophosphokinase